MGMWDWIRDTLQVIAPPTKSTPPSRRQAAPAAPQPTTTAPAKHPVRDAAPPAAEASPSAESSPGRKKKRTKGKSRPKVARAAAPRDPSKPKKPNKGKRRPPGWSGADRVGRSSTTVHEEAAPAVDLTPAPEAYPEPLPSFQAPPEEPPHAAAPPPAVAESGVAAPTPPPVAPAASERAASEPRPPSARQQQQDTLAWILLPKFEALLTEVDEVLAQADAAREVLVAARKRFGREWKALRPIPRSEADRLHAAFVERNGKLDARIAVLPDPRKEEEAKHIEAREAMISAAEALVTEPELKAAIGKAKELQKQWRAAPRLSRDAARKLNDRFKRAMDDVFARRETERAARLERLQALADSAEALTRVDDKVRAAEAIKQLQAQWKEVGGVPGEAGDAVWTRFRGAADLVFEARRAQFAAEQSANVEARQGLIAEAERLAGDGVEDPEEVVRGLHRRWKKIGRVPREQADELWDAFRAACDKLRNPPSLLPEELGDGQDELRFNPFASIHREK